MVEIRRDYHRPLFESHFVGCFSTCWLSHPFFGLVHYRSYFPETWDEQNSVNPLRQTPESRTPGRESSLDLRTINSMAYHSYIACTMYDINNFALENVKGDILSPSYHEIDYHSSIPGSSKYVKFVPFGSFFGWKGTNFTRLENPGIPSWQLFRNVVQIGKSKCDFGPRHFSWIRWFSRLVALWFGSTPLDAGSWPIKVWLGIPEP